MGIGKKSPKAPPPPDPAKTAEAQSKANREAILTSAAVNRYNEVTPWGSVTWERPGQQYSVPSGYNAPTNYATSIPSSTPTSFNVKGNPVNLPPIDTGSIGQTANTAFNAVASPSYAPPISGYGGELEGWTRRTSLSPEMQNQFDQQNQLADILGNMAISRGGQIDADKFSLGGLPDVSTYQSASQPTVRGNVDFSGMQGIDIPGMTLFMPRLPSSPSLRSLPGVPQAPGLPQAPSSTAIPNLPGQVDLPQTPGMPQLPAPGANLPDVPGARSLPSSAQLPSLPGGLDALPDVPIGTMGSDYAGLVDTAERASFDRSMSLMQPEFDRRKRDLATRLSNTGIPVGSEAYNQEMERFNREQNEVINRAAQDAVFAGRQEHSRLAGLDQDRFSQEAARYGMGASRAQQGFDAAARQYGMGADQARQQFGMDVTQFGLGEGQDQRLFDTASRRAQQEFDMGSQSAQQAFDMASRQYGMDAGRAQQAFDMDAARFGMGSQAAQQEFDMAASRFGMDTDSAQRAFDMAVTQHGLGSQQAQQAFEMEAAKFGMDSQQAQQLFDMGSRRFGMDMQRAGFQSNVRGQQLAEQLADADLADRTMRNIISSQGADRSRMLNERLLERTQPMNELAAILQGTPAMQAPASAQPAQYQMAPADVQGAINTAYQGALNNYNTRVGQQQAKKGGATDLASTGAMLYGMKACDRRVKRNIRPVGKLGDYTIYAFNYVWSPDVTDYGPMTDEVKRINPSAVTSIGGIEHIILERL